MRVASAAPGLAETALVEIAQLATAERLGPEAARQGAIFVEGESIKP